jgi:hypothetical protein
MPNIPQYQSEIGTPGVPNLPRASGDDPVADALANFGPALQKIGITMHAVRRDTMVSAAVAKSTAELQDAEFALEKGAMNPDGSIVPAPDPNERETMFVKTVKDVTERNKAGLKDDGLFDLYQRRMAPVVQSFQFTVRKKSIDAQRTQINTEIDGALTVMARVAADGDAVVQLSTKDQAKKMVESAVQYGVYTPDEGAKRLKAFHKDVAVAGLSKLVRDDPDEAGVQLLAGPIEGMDAAEQQKWIDIAIQRSAQVRAQRLAENERVRRETERAKTELQEQTATEGWSLIPTGKLTIGWIEANKNKLSSAERERFTDVVRNGVWITHQPTYTDLLLKASRGIDVSRETVAALENKLIQGSERDTIIGIIRSAPENSVNTDVRFKAGMSYIRTKGAVSPLSPAEGGNDRLAAAELRFRNWFMHNPNASDADIEKEFVTLGEQLQMINRTNMSMTFLSPRFLVGTREAPNFVKTLDATDKALKDGKIDRDTHRREVQLISEWKVAWKLYTQELNKPKVRPEDK